jgi:PAS domain S-box-containing protein
VTQTHSRTTAGALPGPCDSSAFLSVVHPSLPEQERVQALLRTGLLDTPPEEAFDRLTRLATRLLDVPLAIISLVDEHRQFFKSVTGLTGERAAIRQTPRSGSFCQHVVERREPLVIEDARESELVRDNPAIEQLGVIAYLGIPIVAEDLHVIGSLCVVDHKPRVWSAEDIRTLKELCEITITELALRRKSRDQELALAAQRESDMRFREIAETIDDIFWMATPDRSELLYVSPAFERVWGFPRENVYANPRSWLDAVEPGDLPGVLEGLAQSASGVSCEIQYRITHSDGTVRWIRDRSFCVRDESGAVVRVCGVAADITARQQAETEIREANRKLFELSRQAGMAEVASSVLHNVGNVLNSVNVSLSVATDHVSAIKVNTLSRVSTMLRDEVAEQLANPGAVSKVAGLPTFLDKLADHFSSARKLVLEEFEHLRSNIAHIDEIVATQQSYTTAAGLVEDLSVNDIIEDALKVNANAFERDGTQVDRDLDLSLKPLPIDRNKLLLILVNLIRNAKHACGDTRTGEGRVIVRSGIGAHGGIEISVIDNGVGIPAENMSRIFEHGFTTRRNGHGFGLHSSAIAAGEMGGSLHVRSDGPGKGATFIITLSSPPAL